MGQQIRPSYKVLIGDTDGDTEREGQHREPGNPNVSASITELSMGCEKPKKQQLVLWCSL